MKKEIIWVTLLVFTVVWFVLAGRTKDPIAKEHCYTRGNMFLVGSFIVISMD